MDERFLLATLRERLGEPQLKGKLKDAWQLRTRANWDTLSLGLSSVLSEAQIWDFFELAVGKLAIALALHRVSEGEKGWLTIPRQELDLFIARSTEAIKRNGAPRLTISFDDGYLDACRYVQERAEQFGDVEWLVFVCPEKAEQQAAFRWDVIHPKGEEPAENALFDLDRENQRGDLRLAAKRDDCRIATVEQCLRLQRLSNVTLGNHTNCHFRPNAFNRAQVIEDYARSKRDFERLFGTLQHFAFPFGTPEIDFDTGQVEVLRRQGDALLWTTARSPYVLTHRTPYAVLPRFPVNGYFSASQLALWIAGLCLRHQWSNVKPAYVRHLESGAEVRALTQSVTGAPSLLTSLQ